MIKSASHGFLSPQRVESCAIPGLIPRSAEATEGESGRGSGGDVRDIRFAGGSGRAGCIGLTIDGNTHINIALGELETRSVKRIQPCHVIRIYLCLHKRKGREVGGIKRRRTR